ncbi:MAG TPA: exodeoxyribonuclease VII small subunit [Accumulibacter sp.]|uniref:exodeoxyribonuclease VII small subunit n=1 Tax=Accumulibacter sp. TaxID=2053492 RepID=UPI002608D315|nr:exodeoxyribonuclease VII small subunit [Accumulibacter sp.]MDS4054464.1 exodeoxyribonuclease VII small subunit [Accumulibacter sp.]HMV04875.1 exodeoxyribonuclease VII small subunit [Accumulibacter sp.]HMW63712.1 exodeoxyribonuclease VII small subunit [Accumulibacter sp.]HMW80340.1 exodeoxyribonuclease VII small subunit [Accumulibacter sp.]HMX69716.1 exodeoxyribonuclease VII small subunit [Accumulibacter sp.]
MTAGNREPSSQEAVDLHELKFEEALAQLEQIVERMEGGRLALDESLAAYRRGSELLKLCHQQLSEAERQIQILDNGSLRDFAGSSGEAR